MKKKQNKYKKSKTGIDMKITPNPNSKKNSTHTEAINNTTENNSIEQNNRYPNDIQGLFERLGID